MENITRVNLLGALSITTGAGETVDLSLKGQALLILLLLHEPGQLRRDIISDWLWPERGLQQARNSLKQELYVIRRKRVGGPDGIVTRDNILSFKPGQIACDVAQLRARIQTDSSATWQDLTALYGGPLLPHFQTISAEFDAFLRFQRQSVEMAILAALAERADLAANSGAIEQSIAIAERMLAIDPLREDTQRRLIRSYVSAGRRADALRLYSESKALLRRELDVAPALQTEVLVARLRGEATDAAEQTGSRLSVPANAGLSGPPRIAVLKVHQFLEQPLPAYITDGLTADIISQLAGLQELTAISFGSIVNLPDSAVEPHKIGEKLNARYLVFCRLHPAGDQLRLTTELVEAVTNEIITFFNENFDSNLSFADQDRIVGRLVNRLVPHVNETELRRIRGKRPSVMSVYEKILLSREIIMHLDKGRFGQAKSWLDEVIEEDPSYAEAYALASDWHGVMIGERWTNDRANQILAAERLSRTALRYDNCNVRALISFAHRRSMSYRDYDVATKLFSQALDVAPSSALAWGLRGLTEAYAGNSLDAIKHATRAIEISPFDIEAYKFQIALSVAHFSSGHYAEAAEWGRQAIAAKSSWTAAIGYTAASLAAIGRLEEARELATEYAAAGSKRSLQQIEKDVAFREPQLRRRYCELLAAAGYPE